jgi:hypothetical protein
VTKLPEIWESLGAVREPKSREIPYLTVKVCTGTKSPSKVIIRGCLSQLGAKDEGREGMVGLRIDLEEFLGTAKSCIRLLEP